MGKGMRVLLVGGCGFLGLHLIEEFWQLSPRPEIHVLDIRDLPENAKGPYTFDRKQITVHVSDLTNPDKVRSVLEASKPTVVVHSASPVHGMGPQIYHKVNVLGTKTLLQECERFDSVKALVYTSSAGVVFNGEDLFGVDEKMPYLQSHMDEYNATKELGEKAVLRADSPNLRTVAIRPAGIFGPGDRQMIPNLLEVAKTGKNKFQLGDNDNLFDVTYVGNVAYSHVLAAEKLLSNPENVSGKAFFVTNDEPIFFWSFARAIWAAAGYKESPKVALPRNLALVLGYLSQWGCALVGKEPNFTAFRVKTACATRYYDISNAKEHLGYKPKWTLAEALNVTIGAL